MMKFKEYFKFVTMTFVQTPRFQAVFIAYDDFEKLHSNSFVKKEAVRKVELWA